MTDTFKKASKEKSKLRCAIFGPSGAGKTYSALRIATGIADKIALIDTERGSASKYADRFDFDVVDLDRKGIDDYIEFIKKAYAYDVLIIDSLSHGWEELLEDVDKLAKIKYRGNSFSAWSEGTPKQRKLINAILDFPGHIIATMRSRTEWTSETYTDNNGNRKNKPNRVGLNPIQGKNIEFEFDLLLEMNIDNFMTVIKDRTGKFQHEVIEKPDENFGKELLAWLNDGKEGFPLNAYKDKIQNCQNMDDLYNTYKIAYLEAKKTKKGSLMNALESYKESRKKELEPSETEKSNKSQHEIFQEELQGLPY
jgi:hypothetical protein